MIHPPDVIGKYAPDAIIGKLGEGGGDEEEEDTCICNIETTAERENKTGK